MAASPSVAVAIPWFGAWEPWAPLFFESARRNPDIEFLVFTDAATEGLGGGNVTFHALSFDAYLERIHEALGREFTPGNAYKICDYRPMFGVIHEREFRGYDFYGWCDVDLLFGSIRSFYTDAVLTVSDVVSTHADRISGHFALFRNTSRNRSMYRRIYRWREALRNPEFVGLDEHGITNAYRMTFFDRLGEKFGWTIDNALTRFLSVRRRQGMYMKEQYTTPFLPKPWLDGTLDSAQPDTWYWQDGRVTNARDGDRSFLYVHLMNFKSSRWRHDGTPAPWASVDHPCRATVEDMRGAGLVIDPTGIHPLADGGDAPGGPGQP